MHRPEIVAHRGASQHRAEHTLAAYALALEQGAEGLECDVRLTRDGHLVCLHDRTVNRTSNGRGVVSELTLDRLSELDYGQWHHELPDSADELVHEPFAVPSADPAERGLLTLEALLGLIADTRPSVKLFVETKHPVRYAGLVEAKLVAQLHRHGLATPAAKEESPIVVMSFSTRAVRRVREHAPKLPTVLLLARFTPGRGSGELPPWADITGPGIHMLRNDPDYVARSAERGHDTYCWTVDEQADIELCQRLGVRYLATNAPANTRRLLGQGPSATVAQS
ncbi:glycerophosphodiester phosphodiesterase [Kutzneria viridogrisea]|uniref:Glycerophosphoryl diester phosphodiesterase n=2 Tax=Kutzneria TaxID=43356 RepID=A0ABR6BQG8_9PSEU|nr:glycerophosphodiester phosphodiesterase family protein [Kutzneria albida]AHH93482.1 putative glycerophosphoryl diester phosphodiesterase 1 [Kutzneria albida DSM 43870]MBA8929132.1 glycerophosphoryl diester phosphodiesterase [Kutzneria viridogrisea]